MNMNIFTCLTLGLIMASANRGVNAANDPVTFVQDRFVIGFWVDPPADDHMDQHYADIAAANFTMVIGVFRHADGRQAVLINNYSFAFTAWPTVGFSIPIEQVREVCQDTGKEIPVIDDSPAMAGLQISLDSGEGRLYLLPE